MTEHLTRQQGREALAKPKRGNKFGAVKTVVDGIKFASKAEARRYAELKRMERAGEIVDLKLQPRFPLIVNNMLVCTYVGDFAYLDKNSDREVIEDTKGVKTKDFIIKAKLFHALYGKEVTLS